MHLSILNSELHVRVTANMFSGIPGARDERFLYTCLQQVGASIISPADMNKALKDERVGTKF